MAKKTAVKADKEAEAAAVDKDVLEPRKATKKDVLKSLISGEKLSTDGGKTFVQVVGDEIVDQAGKPVDIDTKLAWEVFIDLRPVSVKMEGFINVTKESEGDFWPTSEIAVTRARVPENYKAIAVPFSLEVIVDPITKQIVEK